MSRLCIFAILVFVLCGHAYAANKAEDAPAALDPAVLRINGGFIRLMCAQVALKEAGLKVNSDKVQVLLKQAGADQNALRIPLLKGEITPEEYAEKAEALLNERTAELRRIVGDADAGARLEEAYASPYTAAYVYLNQMRAAVAEVGRGKSAKAADEAVYENLNELSALARQPKRRTPEVIEKIKARAHAKVLATLAPKQREQFETTLAGLTSYRAESAK